MVLAVRKRIDNPIEHFGLLEALIEAVAKFFQKTALAFARV
jgi:hypothetical protein